MENENTSTEETVETSAQEENTETTSEDVDEKALRELVNKTIQEKVNANLSNIEEKTDKLADEMTKSLLDGIAKQRAKAIDTGRQEKAADREVTKQFISAVVNRDFTALKAMSTGSNADGGYTIPKIISNEIIRKANTDFGSL